MIRATRATPARPSVAGDSRTALSAASRSSAACRASVTGRARATRTCSALARDARAAVAAGPGATDPSGTATPRRAADSGSSASSDPRRTASADRTARPGFASAPWRAASRTVDAAVAAATRAERDRQHGDPRELKPNERCLHWLVLSN